MSKVRILAFALALVLAAGGMARAAEPVTIQFLNWASTEETMKSVYKVIDDFEKENPDIKIKNIPVGVGDIRNQLMVMIMGGNPPDVAQLAIGDSVVVYSMGALYSAEDLYSKEFLNRLIPAFYEEARIGDKHAALVWAPNIMTLIYNKKLLSRLGYQNPPKTLDEMEAMMKKGKAEIPNLIGLQLDTTIRTVGFSHVWSFMNAFEYEPIKGKTVKFNTDNMVAFGEWLRRIVKEGYTLPGKRFGEFRPMDAAGRVLFAFDGPIHRGHMKAFNKQVTDEVYDQTWITTSTPTGPSGKIAAAPDDHALVVLRSTKHKEAAAKFVEYLVGSKSSLTKYHQPIGFLPPVKDYATVAPGCFQDAGRQNNLRDAVPHLVNLPFGPNYVKIGTLVMTAVQEIITSDKPVKDILDSYQAKLEGVMH